MLSFQGSLDSGFENGISFQYSSSLHRWAYNNVNLLLCMKKKIASRFAMLEEGEEAFHRPKASDPTKQDFGYPTAGAAYIMADSDRIEAQNMNMKGLRLRPLLYQRTIYMTRSSWILQI